MLLNTLLTFTFLLTNLTEAAIPRRSLNPHKKRACKPQYPLGGATTTTTPAASTQTISPGAPGGNTGATCQGAGCTNAIGATGSEQTTGPLLQSSFTIYGTGDMGGSSSCVATMGSCMRKGANYTVAINEAYYGGHDGGGPGDACGVCYKLTSGGRSIVAVVDNLCPRSNNKEWCGQADKSKGNDWGKTIHFDLCIDSGAANALLAGSGTGEGTAQSVVCEGANATE